MVDGRGTLTAAEHETLVFLEAGPALLGPRTEQTSRHRRPSLFDVPATVAAVRLADSVAEGEGTLEVVRTVDTKVARRLADRGWIILEHGLATLRAHRLAKPLAGGVGDGHAVVCSCGEPFDSWEAAESHQAAEEAP